MALKKEIAVRQCDTCGADVKIYHKDRLKRKIYSVAKIVKADLEDFGV